MAKSSSRLQIRRIAISTSLAAWGVLLVSCGEPSRVSDDDLPPPATYEIQGLVRNVKEQSIGRTQLSIHHEALPEFVGIHGEVESMKSMTMPFTVAESVDLEGIAPGTKILFQLTVDWSAPEPALITGIEQLSPDSALKLGSLN